MTLHDRWLEHVNSLLLTGREIDPRGQPTRERLDERLSILSEGSLLDVPARKLNFRFAVAEWLWIMFGRSDVASIAQYNGEMRRFSDNGLWLTGAYGPHVNPQSRRVLDKLRRDPASRQAVIEIPRPHVETRDEPCTLSLQFILRDGQLHQIATMRSSDAWLGVPYDVFTFAQIQNCLAGALGVKRGWLSLRMGSAHLYEEHAAAARDVLNAVNHLDPRTAATIWIPPLPGRPPNWLENVFLKRDASMIPQLTGSEEIELVAYARDVQPWLPYAHALLARTSAEARDVLTAAFHHGTI